MIGFMIAGAIVNSKLKSKFKNYSLIPTASSMSGKEIAEKMLKDNKIYDVKVISVPGKLTDHYKYFLQVILPNYSVLQEI